MAVKTRSTLSATFYSSSLQQTEEIGELLGRFIQYLYIKGYMLKRVGDHDVMYVSLDGHPGAGKTALARTLLLQNVRFPDQESEEKKRTLAERVSNEAIQYREVTVWIKEFAMGACQENRVRDCGLTQPFKTNARQTTMIMPGRHYPGLEIIEHSQEAPKDLCAVKIGVQGKEEEARSYSVTVTGDFSNDKDSMLVGIGTRWHDLLAKIENVHDPVDESEMPDDDEEIELLPESFFDDELAVS